jgi:hypothetical protein
MHSINRCAPHKVAALSQSLNDLPSFPQPAPTVDRRRLAQSLPSEAAQRAKTKKDKDHPNTTFSTNNDPTFLHHSAAENLRMTGTRIHAII